MNARAGRRGRLRLWPRRPVGYNRAAGGAGNRERAIEDGKLKQIIEIARSKKAEDIRVLDLRRLTWFADHFVIMNGASVVQNRALAETLIEKLPGKPASVEGLANGRWILIDYRDAVIHIFMPEEREFYRLEKLWSDAEEVPLP